jgi:hypothetical protein
VRRGEAEDWKYLREMLNPTQIIPNPRRVVGGAVEIHLEEEGRKVKGGVKQRYKPNRLHHQRHVSMLHT